jgi:hypothetical protein
MNAVVSHQQQLPGMPEPAGLMELIMRAASDPTVDVAKIERLAQLHERMQARAAEIAFNTAMNACQAEIPAVLRNRINEEKASRYADLEQLDKVSRPIYTRHGFALSFGTADCPLPGHARQTCLVSHIGGHSRLYQADIPLDLTGPKGTPNKTGVQGFGSTMSYGQRYLTKLIFNIALTNEDNDGNRAPGETLSEQQIADIRALLTEVKADEAKFLKWAKVGSLAQILAKNYEVCVKAIEAKRK